MQDVLDMMYYQSEVVNCIDGRVIDYGTRSDESDDDENRVVEYEFYPEDGAEQVTQAHIQKVREQISDSYKEFRGHCHHQHDCCGCWFLAGTTVYTSMFSIIVKERWSRNY